MKTFSRRYFLRKPAGQQTECKLFLCVRVGGKRTDLYLNRKINESDWDTAAARPRGRSSSAKELERFMATIEEKLYVVERELIEKRIPVTSQNFVFYFNQSLTGKSLDNRKTVAMIFEEHNKQVLELFEKGQVVRPTYSRYITTQHYFQEFLKLEHKKAEVALAELHGSDALKFEHWLKTKKNCAPVHLFLALILFLLRIFRPLSIR